MNKLKTTYNGATLCVFAVIEKSIMVHLANIDTMASRIYTTDLGYDLIATNVFKTNHPVKYFMPENFTAGYDETEEFLATKTPFRKFDVCVDFLHDEVPAIIRMCNRNLEF